MATESALTVRQAADRLQVHPHTVLSLIHRGALRAMRLGDGPKARYRIAAAALRELETPVAVAPAPAPRTTVESIDRPDVFDPTFW